MAIIPIQEEPQAEIEKRRREESMVRVQGGFVLDIQTIALILVSLALIYLLFIQPQGRPISLPVLGELRSADVIPILTLLLIALLINKAVVNFYEYERGVVLRWGRFHRIAGPGWEVIFPLLERYVKVDLRLEVISPGVQEVVTKDKVRFLVSPEIFLYVSNPKDAILNIQNYKKAVIQYVNSALTHTAGDATSDYIVAHMNEISDMLGHAIEHIAETPGKEWGVVVPRIKLAFIRFPDEVQSAMHKKVASEQLKLASHEKAEAIKIEIDAIREAGGKLSDPALTYMYLEALEKVARGKATKIVLPLEITKIAETMTGKAASVASGAGGKPPQIPISPDIVNQYTKIIDDYEKRLQQIEGRMDAGERKQLEDKAEKETALEKKKAVIESNKRVREEYRKEKKDEDAAELEAYKARIKEIKKRVGIE